MHDNDTATLVAQSLVVIIGLVLIVGVTIGWSVRVWWEDWRDGRADMESQRRWAVGRQRLGRHLR